MLNINRVKLLAPCFLLSLFSMSADAQSNNTPAALVGSGVGSAIVNPIVSASNAPQVGTILASGMQDFNLTANNTFPVLVMNTKNNQCPAGTNPTVMTSVTQVLPMSNSNTYPNLAINVIRANPVGPPTWNSASSRYIVQLGAFGSSSSINGGSSPAFVQISVQWILFCLPGN